MQQSRLEDPSSGVNYKSKQKKSKSQKVAKAKAKKFRNYDQTNESTPQEDYTARQRKALKEMLGLRVQCVGKLAYVKRPEEKKDHLIARELIIIHPVTLESIDIEHAWIEIPKTKPDGYTNPHEKYTFECRVKLYNSHITKFGLCHIKNIKESK